MISRAPSSRSRRRWRALSLAATLAIAGCGASPVVPDETGDGAERTLAEDARWWVRPGLPTDVLGGLWEGALARIGVDGLLADPSCGWVELAPVDAVFPLESARVPESWRLAPELVVHTRATKRVAVSGCADDPRLRVVELHFGALLVTAPGAAMPAEPGDAGVVAHAGWEWRDGAWHAGHAVVAARVERQGPGDALCDARGWADRAEPWLDARAEALLLSPSLADAAAERAEALRDDAAALLDRACVGGPSEAERTWLGEWVREEPVGALAALPSAWVLAAIDAADRGRVAEALAWAETALDRRPDHSAALLVRARLVRDVSGRLGEALDSLDAIRAPQWRAIAAYERGVTLLRQGAPGLAREAFAESAEADAAYPEPRMALGAMAWADGDSEMARAHFESTLAIRPNHPGALANLGVYEESVRDDAYSAAALYDAAIAADEHHVDALLNAARLRLRALGGAQEARAMLERAAELAPSDRDIRFELDALDARPAMSLRLLDGLWRAEAVDEDGRLVSLVATWSEGSGTTVAEREGTLRRSERRLEVVRELGPELQLIVHESERSYRAVFEALSEDIVVSYEVESPVETRLEWHRWSAEGDGV